MIITIDGPSASGKSSLGRALASRLGLYYIYSGLLYRALAYLLINEFGYKQEQLVQPNRDYVEELINPKRFVYRYDDQEKERIFFDGQEITPFLKESIIDKGASLLSTNKHVRELLTKMQRKLAQKFDIVIDGRDAGSVVFPEADIKFFLSAEPRERARRWREQQKKRGVTVSLDEAEKILRERDKRDSERSLAPLVIATDAQVVNNTHLSQDQTLEYILDLIQKISLLELNKFL